MCTHSGGTTCEGSTLRHITALNHFSKHTAHTCQILAVADRNVFILLLQADKSWRCVNKCVCLYFPSGKPDRSFRGAAWPVSSSNYAFWNSHKRQKHRPVRAHTHIHTGWQELIKAGVQAEEFLAHLSCLLTLLIDFAAPLRPLCV